MSQEPEAMFPHAGDASLAGAGGNVGDVPYPQPIQTCPPCQPIATEIDDLNGQLYDLGVQLYNSQGDKGEILKQIKEVKQQVAVKAGELHQCEVQNGCAPTQLQYIQGTLDVSQVEAWTDNPQYPTLYPDGFTLTLTFVGNPGTVWNVTRLDLTPFSIKGGKVTINYFNGGHFDPASGSMDLDGGLRAHIDDLTGGKDSDIGLTFTTGTVQVPFTLPFSLGGVPV